MYNGILPVYKERGLTSHDVVFKLRKILKTKKIGHTGTLDPEVAGVLPVCIGNATRVSDYVMDMGKAYEATVSIGRSTTTEDQTGDTLEMKGVHSADFNNDDIDRLLENFKGVIEQIPPMYSSVKVNGKKLYEYARNNETVERPKRKVNIKDSHIKKRILNGQKFNKNEFDNKIKDQIVFIDDDSEKVLAIYMVHPTKESEIKPKK
ncbi:tRNA pseudouridine(55) synthase TruB, partial [Staphylococcus aureus]|nr:tRNA pseudouridine(55) synthase TruB [Staphylococcus aureus]